MSMSFACASHSLDPRAAIAFSSWRVGGIALLFEIVMDSNEVRRKNKRSQLGREGGFAERR